VGTIRLDLASQLVTHRDVWPVGDSADVEKSLVFQGLALLSLDRIEEAEKVRVLRPLADCPSLTRPELPHCLSAGSTEPPPFHRIAKAIREERAMGQAS
jgi:hypothetical protein